MKTEPFITLSSCSIRKSCEVDAHLLAPNLREADKQEVVSATGRKPVESLVKGYKLGLECYTVDDNRGEPIAMYGISGLDDGKGVAIWALASRTLVTECREDFKAQSKLWLAKVLKKYKHVYNYVDVRNKVHIKWLKDMGFSFGEDYELGKNGELFRYFYKHLTI
tara:strand:+ start:12781 stop:13275 length:495 start_codon:yes stop_codon:yes gene_type:complete